VFLRFVDKFVFAGTSRSVCPGLKYSLAVPALAAYLVRYHHVLLHATFGELPIVFILYKKFPAFTSWPHLSLRALAFRMVVDSNFLTYGLFLAIPLIGEAVRIPDAHKSCLIFRGQQR